MQIKSANLCYWDVGTSVTFYLDANFGPETSDDPVVVTPVRCTCQKLVWHIICAMQTSPFFKSPHGLSAGEPSCLPAGSKRLLRPQL